LLPAGRDGVALRGLRNQWYPSGPHKGSKAWLEGFWGTLGRRGSGAGGVTRPSPTAGTLPSHHPPWLRPSRSGRDARVLIGRLWRGGRGTANERGPGAAAGGGASAAWNHGAGDLSSAIRAPARRAGRRAARAAGASVVPARLRRLSPRQGKGPRGGDPGPETGVRTPEPSSAPSLLGRGVVCDAASLRAAGTLSVQGFSPCLRGRVYGIFPGICFV
jgi:hypothetical protein